MHSVYFRLFLLFAAVTVSISTIVDDSTLGTRLISVSGTGTVTVAPDLAIVSLGIQRRDLSMQIARDSTVSISSAFIDLCTRIGIKDSKIRTSGKA